MRIGNITSSFTITAPTAVPTNGSPDIFIGTVTFDGAPAQDGLTVSAWAGGVRLAVSTVSNGSYNLGVPLPSNITLTFKVDDHTAHQTVTWEAGAESVLNLSTSSGGSSPPHIFIGKAKVDGRSAPAGALVTAYIDGVPQGASTVKSDGSYKLRVNQGEGASITFKIGNLTAHQSATWKQGGANVLELSAG